jgi:uncharacterized protein
MSHEIVNVVYRKYDGSLHWNHPSLLLGEDEHGVWIGCTAGSGARKGDGPVIPSASAFVMLFPRDGWWTASFNALPNRVEIYCDIATVPQWSDGEVTMIDLDLDVIRMRDGRVILDDEDEFEEHQIRYAYPPDVIENARTTAARLMEAVRTRAAPFGAAPHWLAQVT